MKTIEVDDELYQYIASQTRHIGESASDILRRMLKISAASQPATPVTKDVVSQPSVVAQAKPAVTPVKDKVRAMRELPFDDASFEVVISRYSAHHWHDVGQALREVKRVLKPGGIFIIMDVMSPGHPVRNIWLQTVEALRDTSHVQNYASGEWLSLITEAGLIARSLITDRLPLEFSSWIARMRTPEALSQAIRLYQESASAEVKAYFELQDDGSFTSDTIMAEAQKAG